MLFFQIKVVSLCQIMNQIIRNLCRIILLARLSAILQAVPTRAETIASRIERLKIITLPRELIIDETPLLAFQRPESLS